MTTRQWIHLFLTPIIAGIAGNISLALVPDPPLRWIIAIPVMLVVGIGWMSLLLYFNREVIE